MDNIMPMATTVRHNELISSLLGEIYGLLKKKEVHILQSDCALVHWGRKDKNEPLFLININDSEEIEDIEDFLKITINELDYVKPDFMIFKNNPYLRNERETRTAGQPDLVVEIWSRDNTKLHKKRMVDLYCTSPITEHWYIKQDSNEVECYYGKEKLKSQSLKDVLRTQGGIEFDLRHLMLT
ncbi:MAG: Uma2 family endonuclease [Firmicutes bacterium]|nr:Uma2 family endonuclease [Bacillota bacterium]